MKTRATILMIAAMLTMSTWISPVRSQVISDPRGLLSYATVLDGDTVPLVHLRTVVVSAKWSLLTEKEIRKNQKLIRNVKKTLPYAKEARRRLQDRLR